MTRPPEILDIEEAANRWDELLDRVEAGATFVISVDGQPKVELVPIPPDESTEILRSPTPDAGNG
jgi:antitoxin (DNA-binding transcriptional repressor) of toxin-antitoxin stability system